MSDQDLSRWIVEKVFEEKWHELCDVVHHVTAYMPYIYLECVCGACAEVDEDFLGGDIELLEHLMHCKNPNLCTPDGSAMLKAKAQELGVWDEFVTYLREKSRTIFHGIYVPDNDKVSDTVKAVAEILTTPRLFAEAFRAYWIKKGE